MDFCLQPVSTDRTPESLVEALAGEPGIVLLRSLLFESPQARYSFVTARPFLTFQSFGSRCELISHPSFHPPQSTFRNPQSVVRTQFGDPWRVLDRLMGQYEILDELDLPFPLGGCFGYWGYDLKNFVEPTLPRRAANDLELPDCRVGFYDSLVAFDHRLGKVWLISTGLAADGSRSDARAGEKLEFWGERLRSAECGVRNTDGRASSQLRNPKSAIRISSAVSRDEFLAAVKRAQDYIRAGDIYQVNLSQRLTAASGGRDGMGLFEDLCGVSPAPYAAFLDCGDFQIASSSPEQFLRMSGSHIQTRPIKGTRPRSADPTRDAQLAYELQTSEKELAELVMITDLMRNDLGKICEFGSVQVPELARLERYSQVQHLVSTVEGALRPGMTHFGALASCFPGGSVTGAPKIRAMQIIDELEPLSRGAYTGALGYVGFNRESQLSIVIRTAVCKDALIHFPVGAGIVADSNPEAEYEETLAKAAGFIAALKRTSPEIMLQCR